jgi:hypothetical protein
MFTSTLDICDKVVQTALKKGLETGVISPDKRGSHHNRSTVIPEATKLSIRDHINLYPRVPSHFCRQDNQREYLAEDLTVSKMHAQYLLWMSSQGGQVKAASERQYRDYFNSEFNLGFHQPKKDQCDLCFKYNNANQAEKAKLQEIYDKHQADKAIVRDLKARDVKYARQQKGRPTLCTATFDLQQVLLVPEGETSAFFYIRRLSLYNFTIYDCGKSEGYCYSWHQGIAGRGAVEFSSCLYAFLKQKIAEGIIDFRFYADNCSAQNKNRVMFAMLHHVSVKYNVSITLRYLQTGHTQMEADSMHSLIERHRKGKNIFVPKHWYDIMREAKQTGKKYSVKEMAQEDFVNYKDLVAKENWDKTSVAGQKPMWNTIKEFTVKGDKLVLMKHDWFSAPVELDPAQRRGHPVNLQTYEAPAAYFGPLPLKPLLLKDLKELCEKQLIPSEHHDFYLSLSVGEISGELIVEEEDEANE